MGSKSVQVGGLLLARGVLMVLAVLGAGRSLLALCCPWQRRASDCALLPAGRWAGRACRLHITLPGLQPSGDMQQETGRWQLRMSGVSQAETNERAGASTKLPNCPID